MLPGARRTHTTTLCCFINKVLGETRTNAWIRNDLLGTDFHLVKHQQRRWAWKTGEKKKRAFSNYCSIVPLLLKRCVNGSTSYLLKDDLPPKRLWQQVSTFVTTVEKSVLPYWHPVGHAGLADPTWMHGQKRRSLPANPTLWLKVMIQNCKSLIYQKIMS